MKRKHFVYFAVSLFILLSLFCGCGKNKEEKLTYDVNVNIYDNGLIGVDLTIFYPLKSRKEKEVVFNVTANPKIIKSGDEWAVDGYIMSVNALSVNGSKADFIVSEKDDGTFKIEVNDNAKDGTCKIMLKYYVRFSGVNDLSKFEGLNLGDFIACVQNSESVNGYESGDCKKVLSVPLVFDAKVKITVPSTYALAVWKLAKSCDVAGDKTAYGYELFNVKNLSFSISQNYNVNCQKLGYKPVNYYFFNDETAFLTMELLKNCLAFYQNAFGNYPYDGFLLCQTNGNNPSVSTASVFVPKNFSGKEYLYAVALETARQWWGVSVFPKDECTEQIIEGIAYYACFSFFESNKGYGIDAEKIREDVINSVRAENIVNAHAVETFTFLLSRDKGYGKADTLDELKRFYLSYENSIVQKSDLTNLSYLN